jgi:hypothetical protein
VRNTWAAARLRGDLDTSSYLPRMTAKEHVMKLRAVVKKAGYLG